MSKQGGAASGTEKAAAGSAGAAGSAAGSETAIAAILADYGARLAKAEEGAGEILSLLKNQGGEIEGRLMEALKGAVADATAELKKSVELHLAEMHAQILAEAKSVAAAGGGRSIIPDSGARALTGDEAAALADIEPEDLLDFALHPDRLVVVTTDGRKLSIARP